MPAKNNTPRNGSTYAWRQLRARVIRRARFRGKGTLACHWCRRVLDENAPPQSVNAVEVDHLDPVFTGSPVLARPDRLVVACPSCNKARYLAALDNAQRQRLDLEGLFYRDVDSPRDGGWYHEWVCGSTLR